MDAKKIILLGPPGSGKGTQAKRLAGEFQIPHISTGDLLRNEIKQGSSIGREVSSLIDAGQLVPEAIVLKILEERTDRADCSKGYILDGVPRTLSQAQKLATKWDKTPLFVVYLDVPDEIIIQRAAGRLVCRECGTVYNKMLIKDRKKEQCEKCTGALYRRPDDAEEVVRERLKVYEELTKPLLDYYIRMGLLHSYNANQEPDLVYKELQRNIHPFLKSTHT